MSYGGRRLRLVWLAFALAACTRGEPVATEPRLLLHPEGRKPVAVRVEVADTPQSRSLGLMFRRDLADDQGMVFFFERDAVQSFWMKNTPLSLDMIFISAEGRIVGIATDTEPFSLRGVSVAAPSRVVLEVKAGFSKRHGLAAGDRVTYENVASPLLPSS